MIKFHLVFLLFIFLTLTATCQTIQDSSKVVTYRSIPRPSCILVMLHLSTNKIEGMKKRGMHNDIDEVINADASYNESIMNDFAMNFSFCPVYFFYDTCYEKAKNKQWSDIVFYDYESLTMKKRVFSNSFSNYFFTEISYRVPETHFDLNTNLPESMIDRYQGDEGVVATHREGFNLYNEDFEPLSGKLLFTEVLTRRHKKEKKFIISPAARLEKKLLSVYEPAALNRK